MYSVGEIVNFNYHCSCCYEHDNLSYFKEVSEYPVTKCCNGLICNRCYQNRRGHVFTCNLCSSQTGIGVRNKNGYRFSYSWINCFKAYLNFYIPIEGEFKYLIPFTRTGIFGTWEKVGGILSNMNSLFRHKQEFIDFRERYHKFVGNFYTHVFLLHTLRSAAIRRLNCMRFKTSPMMLEFFKLIPDMAIFSNHSRKKILRWGLNGFNYFILDKLSLNLSLQVSQGEKSVLCVKEKFLVMLLRIVLAKKSTLQ